MVNFMPLPLYASGNKPQYALEYIRKNSKPILVVE
jgi:hypothetical protein